MKRWMWLIYVWVDCFLPISEIPAEFSHFPLFLLHFPLLLLEIWRPNSPPSSIPLPPHLLLCEKRQRHPPARPSQARNSFLVVRKLSPNVNYCIRATNHQKKWKDYCIRSYDPFPFLFVGMQCLFLLISLVWWFLGVGIWGFLGEGCS